MLELGWVVGVTLFTIARFALAYSALARYSRTTVVVFGVLDVATAVPYALGTARVVTNLVDRRYQAAMRWGMVACISFLAPYLWLVWAGRESYPVVVYAVIAVLVVLLGTNAVVGVLRRVRSEGAAPSDVVVEG